MTGAELMQMPKTRLPEGPCDSGLYAGHRVSLEFEGLTWGPNQQLPSHQEQQQNCRQPRVLCDSCPPCFPQSQQDLNRSKSL